MSEIEHFGDALESAYAFNKKIWWPTSKKLYSETIEALKTAHESSVSAIQSDCQLKVEGYKADVAFWGKLTEAQSVKNLQKIIVALQAKSSTVASDYEDKRAGLAKSYEDYSSTLEQNFNNDKAEYKTKAQALSFELLRLTQGISEASDTITFQDVALYDYYNPAEASVTLKVKLDKSRADSKALIKVKQAVKTNGGFTFNNSKAEGKKFESDFANLVLSAYNSEVENAIAKAERGKDIQAALTRIDRARERVAKLGTMLSLSIDSKYHRLRKEEIELAFKFKEALAAEKEEEKERRADLREEERVERELKKAQEVILRKEREILLEVQARERELEAERNRLQAEANELRVKGLDKEYAQILYSIEKLDESDQKLSSLKLRMNTIELEKDKNKNLLANARAGYVYVISNKGSFGESIVKIGLTRRAEPLERVNELGGASVPFRFGVHVIHYSTDAVTLETELHRAFVAQAVNKVNKRKEFFRVTPAEVLVEMNRLSDGNILTFDSNPVVDDYVKTLQLESQTVVS